jgi:type IV pilus assembly protein PilO
MATIAEQRQRMRFAAVLMGVVCLLAIIYLLSPLSASSAQKQQELLDRQRQLRAAEEQTRPLQQLPQLVAKAQSDIAHFSTERLPAYPSSVYNTIYDLARKSNVNMGDVKYESFDTLAPPLQLLQVKARVSGGYPNLVRFINAIERSRLFFVIDGLQLGETRGSDGSIQLSLTLETYLRPRAENEKPQVASSSSPGGEEDEQQ